MATPLSNDMRKRIIDAKLRGDSEQKIASEKSICKKIWSLYKSTGSYFPRSNFRGRKPKFSDAQLEEISAAILENSDITLQELIDKFSLQISVPGLSKIVRFKLDFRYKKSLCSSEQLTASHKLKRHNCQIKQPEMDFNRLVFLAESSINTGMTRFYGRAKKGDRVVEHIPDIRFERTTILSSVRANCEIVPMLFSGSLNGEIFKK